MLDKLLKEIQELKKYKEKYEHVVADKERMSEVLYKLMMENYQTESYEERKQEYINEKCKYCRHKESCDMDLPKDINKPIRSDKAWIPTTLNCINFAWD